MILCDKKIRIVKDQDAIDGAAASILVNKAAYKLPFEMGIYNLQSTKNICTTLNLKDIPKDN